MSVIIRLWLWLLKRLGLLKPPSGLLTLELDMANARLNWTNSTPDLSRQLPLAGTRIESRVSDTLPFREVAFVEIPGDTLPLQDLASGDWQFQGIEVDDVGGESSPKSATLAIPFEGPSGLVTFEAVLE